MLALGAMHYLSHAACLISTPQVEWTEVGWHCKWRIDAMQCRDMLTSRAENTAWIVGV